MFRGYVALADSDGRQAFDFDVTGELDVGDDELSVSVDLALIDPNGYAGRIILWDQQPCDREAALTIAGPALALLARELGSDRVDNIEVWHMPSRARFAFDADEARAALARIGVLLQRIRPA
jgi:hypothetical protein